MNTTARHESTGAPGKIHCSQTTQEELQEVAPGNFSLQERGYIDMKGKGELLTYWLEASESNELVNKAALEKLDDEVKDLLAKGNFDNKVGPQKTGKTDDSSMKQLERGSGNSASMMKKTPDPLSNTLKEAMRSDSWKSLAASPEKKVKSREVQRNDSFITSIEEAVVLASGYDSLSGFDESETEINLKFEAGQQLELLKRSAQFVAEEKLEVRVERNADKYERPSKPVKCGKNTPSDQGRSKRTRKRNANEKKTTSAEPVPAVKPLDSFEIGYKVNYAQYLLPSRTATYRS